MSWLVLLLSERCDESMPCRDAEFLNFIIRIGVRERHAEVLLFTLFRLVLGRVRSQNLLPFIFCCRRNGFPYQVPDFVEQSVFATVIPRGGNGDRLLVRVDNPNVVGVSFQSVARLKLELVARNELSMGCGELP